MPLKFFSTGIYRGRGKSHFGWQTTRRKTRLQPRCAKIYPRVWCRKRRADGRMSTTSRLAGTIGWNGSRSVISSTPLDKNRVSEVGGFRVTDNGGMEYDNQDGNNRKDRSRCGSQQRPRTSPPFLGNVHGRGDRSSH